MLAVESDPIYLAFGKRLRHARLSIKLTQQQVAAFVGLTRTSITNIERGRQVVALHTLFAFAACLRVDPKSLLPAKEKIRVPAARIRKELGEAEKDWVVRVLKKGNQVV
jgi:transcriptional regulator with XRE-family HTH domain